MKLRVEKLIAGGDGLARHQGKVVFLPGTAPGDLVEAEILEEKKGFSRAKVVEILENSQHRRQPFCHFYGRCGGCNLQHIDYSYQLQSKRDIFQETLKRLGGIEWDSIEVFSGPDRAYRNRVQFQPADQGHWGFRQRASHNVIALEECPLLVQGLNDFLSNPPEIPADEQRLQVYGTDSRYWLNPQEPIELSLLGKSIQFNSSLFFQSNLSMLEDFITHIIHGQKGEVFLDLYGGVGLFSLFLQDHFDRGIWVESFGPSKIQARENLSDRVELITKPLEKWKPTKGLAPDLAIIDPPRVGLAPQARKSLIALKPQRIVYVSCDPVTQARDLKEILGVGYNIDRVALFDFYPHTAHMETVVHLSL
ncbi:MAG: class I SAM-dependent RNA methyltransferase [Spirochaetaceae bacterium]|nr:class I SAM-dependent RNA methyltransferase [Spirochaetaceae bacterium]